MRGDFIGFTLDGIHSSALNVLRISDGSRYTLNLLPQIQDKTIKIPGSDGTYLFATTFKQYPITFPIFYDAMTETNMRELRALVGQKKMMDLIFDETPYKVYRVKANGTPSLKYVCFDIENPLEYWRERSQDAYHEKDEIYGQRVRSPYGRIYKGEGNLSFVSYAPFARSRYKYLEDYTIDNVPEWGPLHNETAAQSHNNLQEWITASRIKSRFFQQNDEVKPLDRVDLENNEVYIYNAGDLDTPFILKFYFDAHFCGGHIELDGCSLYIRAFDLIRGDHATEDDAGFQINTKLHLLEGINSNGSSTGTVYNRFITAGDFFKIAAAPEIKKMGVYLDSPDTIESVQIVYDYLYY